MYTNKYGSYSLTKRAWISEFTAQNAASRGTAAFARAPNGRTTVVFTGLGIVARAYGNNAVVNE